MAEWLIIAWLYVVGGVAVYVFDSEYGNSKGNAILICAWPFAITALTISYFIVSAWKREWQ